MGNLRPRRIFLRISLNTSRAKFPVYTRRTEVTQLSLGSHGLLIDAFVLVVGRLDVESLIQGRATAVDGLRVDSAVQSDEDHKPVSVSVPAISMSPIIIFPFRSMQRDYSQATVQTSQMSCSLEQSWTSMVVRDVKSICGSTLIIILSEP